MRLLTEEEIKLVAHTKDTKRDKRGCVIKDATTHSPDWIDEMLQFGMSVFEAVVEEEHARTLKAVGEWGAEYCTEHNEVAWPEELGGGTEHRHHRVKRRRCKHCWQAFKQGEMPEEVK